MILGLPIDGTQVSGTVSLGGWRDSIATAISMQPPNVPVDQKDKKMMGVHSRWLTAHFNMWPEDAKDAVIQRYALSCLWHMNDK
jgi:hypothetical protein